MLLEYFTLFISILFKLFSLWFIATSIMFWRKSVPYKKQNPETRFACLIPARNEENVIGDIIHSLKLQNYPDDLYDIYVIPNNCNDNTEAVARDSGAIILNCSAPVNKKGDVLHRVFRLLTPETHDLNSEQIGTLNYDGFDYDAFCVFDADNYVDAEFLASMNDAFLSGVKIAKGQLRAKNPKNSWVSGCYALYYGLFETIYNRSRAVLGLSAKLVGTGFMVSRDLIVEMGGWNTETIAEDAEFSALCSERGVRIHWVPSAITFDEAPTTFNVSLKQRHRWCSGIMNVSELKFSSLLHAKGILAIDMLFFLAGPYVQALSLLPSLMGILCHIVNATTVFLVNAPISLVISCIGITLLAIFITARIKESIPLMAKSIIMFPLFMASWMPIQMFSLIRRADKWHEIKHYGIGYAHKRIT